MVKKAKKNLSAEIAKQLTEQKFNDYEGKDGALASGIKLCQFTGQATVVYQEGEFLMLRSAKPGEKRGPNDRYLVDGDGKYYRL